VHHTNTSVSIRLFARLLLLSNQLTFGLDRLHVCGSLPWLTGDWNWRSQVKVRTQLQFSSQNMSSACGVHPRLPGHRLGNSVPQSPWLVPPRW